MTRRSQTVLLACLLALMTVLVFWPALSLPFIQTDDPDYVTQNEIVQQGLTLRGVGWTFTNAYADNWHPLTTLSHMLDCSLFGLDPMGHHATSIVLHAVNAALMFLLLQQLTGAVWRSAIVAAVFAWHPLRVESVAWVAERKDVLSTLLALLTLLSYVRYVKEPHWRRFVWVVVLFSACLLAKSMYVTLPFLLLLLDHWPLGRWGWAGGLPLPAVALRPIPVHYGLKRCVVEKAPLLLMSIGLCVVTIMVQRAGDAVVRLDGLPMANRFENAAVSYVRYVQKLFWPSDLAILYPHPGTWRTSHLIIALTLLASITTALWLIRRRHPYGLIGWLWYIGMLVPVIGIVQVGLQAMADRYTYFPLVGAVLAIVWLVHALAARPVIRIALSAGVAAVLVVLIVRTRSQLMVWRDTITLYQHTVEVTDNNWWMHLQLGRQLAWLGRQDDAFEHFKRAAMINREDSDVLSELGVAFLMRGEVQPAIAVYEQLLEVQPDNVPALNNLAWYAATHPDATMRDGAKAVAMAEKACRLRGHQDAGDMDTLAAAYAEAGRFEDAVSTAGQALTIAIAAEKDALAAQIREHLASYESQRSWRDQSVRE